ncbi:MAG: large subunit ribosomal protein [Patescibacteria group bacterium]|nr:large subunit ribosomal protein [Patescibacteria group bacterium]
MKLTAINTTGTKSTVTVSDSVFGGPVRDQLLGQAVRVYTSNSHQGTSKVKTRAEVARTKKKWFKQKGTGNARHAARSAPIFVGGGVAHGPKGVRPANLTLSQQQKRQALKSALSLQSANIIVSEGVEKMSVKTAAAAKTLKNIVADPGLILLVISKWNADLEQGVRNIAFVKVTTAEHVTVMDVCSADNIIISPEAVEALSARVETKKRVTKTVAAEKKAPVKAEKTEKKEAKPVVKKTAAPKATKKVTKK